MSTLSAALQIATRPYTPLAFRPPTERIIVAALVLAAVALWLVVIPLELALG